MWQDRLKARDTGTVGFGAPELWDQPTGEVWELCMLSPNEYYDFVTTGVYPLAIENPPQVPEIQKSPEELGKKAANKTKKST